MKILTRLPPVLVTFCLSAGAQQATPPDDVVLRAMQDEMGRAQALRVAGLGPPYYVEYSIHDAEGLTVTASLGAVIVSTANHFRQPDVAVRVGSPDFDNTNYLLSEASFGSRYHLGALPIDDDYRVLRHYFWLATDHAFKSAHEAIARKRAALKNVNVAEEVADFARAEPSRLVLDVEREPISETQWQSTLRNLSATLAGYREIVESDVRLQAVQGALYFVNTEGAMVRVPEKMAFVRVRASAQAPDGMVLRNSLMFHVRRFRDMPSEADMRAGILRMADDLVSLCKAPVGEPYSGPVLFEAQAAAQIFAEVLGRNFALRRRPVSEPGRPLQFLDSELEGRIESRVLPDWMDVVDDPAVREWRGQRLFGHYAVDLEGVHPKPLTLVEKGILKNFLLTRQPHRGFAGSNGRARLPGNFGARAAVFGNLFVKANQTVSPEELKKKLLEVCRQRNKPYGILVRKMDFPSSASIAELRRLAARLVQPGSRPVSLPLLAYRVHPDGREELLRGLRFQGLTTRSFRDILAAGDDPFAFHFLENGAPFALMGVGSYTAESSVIAPSVLFDDLQLSPLQEELPKPPVVPAPALASP